jgi:hypothetical protein
MEHVAAKMEHFDDRRGEMAVCRHERALDAVIARSLHLIERSLRVEPFTST